MSRSLNPQLFGPIDSTGVKIDPSSVAQNQMQQKKIRDIEAQVEVLNQKLDRWAQLIEGKIQQLQSGQKHIVEHVKQVAENFSAQQAALISKMNERRGADAKAQELIDRHNQIVHSFEARVCQIQKVSSEQEMKLMSYQATYDEILREIRSLKAR